MTPNPSLVSIRTAALCRASMRPLSGNELSCVNGSLNGCIRCIPDIKKTAPSLSSRGAQPEIIRATAFVLTAVQYCT